MIFETHAHYDDEAFAEDGEMLLQELPSHGIDMIMNIGASMDSCRRTLRLMDKYPHVYGAIGVHPSETGELTKEDMLWLKEQCAHPKCLAVGEIGLDYYWDKPDRDIQKKWFTAQLRMAREVSLPVVIHSRDAARDTAAVMKEEQAQNIGGVIHCYSYTKETAETYLDMGFYFGIGGVITFHNAKKLKEAVAYIPIDRIVTETDCPYLAPVPYRGKRNSSLYLPYIIQEIAAIKGMTAEEVEQITYENALNLYKCAKKF